VSIITLTTDFGCGSPYVAAMKGVILSINPQATIVDITHDIGAQDIRQGAVVLDDISRLFPKDTIHVAVIDPGVGSDRAIIFANIGEQNYVVPDNGLLSRLLHRQEASKVISLDKPEYWLKDISATFHGRDIMAPVAAHLSLGLNPNLLGRSHQTPTTLDWPEVQEEDERIRGVVEGVDSFGNLSTNITADMFGARPTDERVVIVCGIYETWGIYRTYSELPLGTLVALVGSTGHLELAVVGDNAAERLGLQVGTPVVVAWE
jgi:S-adenosylmethionine hydrolase